MFRTTWCLHSSLRCSASTQTSSSIGVSDQVGSLEKRSPRRACTILVADGGPPILDLWIHSTIQENEGKVDQAVVNRAQHMRQRENSWLGTSAEVAREARRWPESVTSCDGPLLLSGPFHLARRRRRRVLCSRVTRAWFAQRRHRKTSCFVAGNRTLRKICLLIRVDYRSFFMTFSGELLQPEMGSVST